MTNGMSPRPNASYKDAIRRPLSVCGLVLAMRDPIRADPPRAREWSDEAVAQTGLLPHAGGFEGLVPGGERLHTAHGPVPELEEPGVLLQLQFDATSPPSCMPASKRKGTIII